MNYDNLFMNVSIYELLVQTLTDNFHHIYVIYVIFSLYGSSGIIKTFVWFFVNAAHVN